MQFKLQCQQCGSELQDSIITENGESILLIEPCPCQTDIARMMPEKIQNVLQLCLDNLTHGQIAATFAGTFGVGRIGGLIEKIKERFGL
jgi:hypothetical protein